MNAIQLIQKANLKIERSFCEICSIKISNRLKTITGIQNIRTYPLEAIISFHFEKPNDLSNALNELTELGYPEKGEIIHKDAICLHQHCCNYEKEELFLSR